MGAVVASVAAWPAAFAMLWQVPVVLFASAVSGTGKAVNRLVTDPDQVAFQAHAAGDLFRRPASFQAILDGGLQLRVRDQLAVDGMSALIGVPCGHGIVAVQRGDLEILIDLASQLPVRRRRYATQPVSNLRNRHSGFTPLAALVTYFQTQGK